MEGVRQTPFLIRKKKIMNDLLAQYIVGLVTDEMISFILSKKEELPYASKEEGEHSLGQSVKGFAYTDMKKNPFDNQESWSESYPALVGELSQRYVRIWVSLKILVCQTSKWLFLDILPEIKETGRRKVIQLYVKLDVDKKDAFGLYQLFRKNFRNGWTCL